jgi:hypothetical protein
MFCKCPRCFWLLKRHNIKQPDSYPLALNNCMDQLLKAEFDQCRAAGQPHPILVEFKIAARLFSDLPRLTEWRNNFQGVRWTDPATGHTLFGAVDEILEFPDGALAVMDYKSSGAAEARVYDSYQLQMDVYTFLLQRLGYRTAPKAFFAFFMAVRDQGFHGRLPFRGVILEVTPQPERVPPLLARAVATAQQDRMPDAGPECDLCRWSRDTTPLVAPASAKPTAPVPSTVPAPPPKPAAAAAAAPAPAATVVRRTAPGRATVDDPQGRFEFSG